MSERTNDFVNECLFVFLFALLPADFSILVLQVYDAGGGVLVVNWFSGDNLRESFAWSEARRELCLSKLIQDLASSLRDTAAAAAAA